MLDDYPIGRDLEIAVAKALGWTCTTHADDWHNVMGPANEWGADGETVAEAWEQGAPKYLTDPIAFASVLAALAGGYEAGPIVWGIRSDSTGAYHAHVERHEASSFRYQEALCRALVASGIAWKTNAS
jgi:hypothetical protein